MAKDNVKRETQRSKRKRIALDFDGVLHTYSKKWHDGTIYDVPVEGSVEAVQTLAKDYDLVIFTCRPSLLDVFDWVKLHFGLEIPVTAEKPHADIYIDDRGYHFDGSWANAVWEITTRKHQNFENWNHRVEAPA